MANEQNLRPFTSEQSREEAVKNGKKGGKKSVAKRRKNKEIRESLELIGSTKIDVDGEKMSGIEALAFSAFRKAWNGDVKAMEFIRDTLGQKPVEKVIIADVDPSVIDEVESMVLGDDDAE